MKRLLAFFLICLLLIPLCLSLPTGAVEVTEGTATEHLSIEKNTFYQTEPIMVTPNALGDAGCWFGIVPEKDGAPFLKGGAIYWKYVTKTYKDTRANGLGDQVAADVRSGCPVSGTNTDTNAKFTYRFIGLPAGTYYIIFVPQNGYAYQATEAIKITITPPITAEKTNLAVDESIWVTPHFFRANDWIGISKRVEDGTPQASIFYTYVNSGNDNTRVDLLAIAKDKGKTLPAGKYSIIFVANNYSISNINAGKYGDKGLVYYEIPISIGCGEMKTNKTEYKYGEPILITELTGFQKDWVGIQRSSDQNPAQTIRWDYVKDIALPFDIRTASNVNSKESEYQLLPPGTYELIFVPDDKGFQKKTESISITITSEPLAPPAAPVGAEYALNHPTDGFADGTVTVRLSGLSEENTATDIVMYWGNDNGRLEGYTALARHKVAGDVTVITMAPHSLIPAGATKLLVYAYNAAGLSDAAEVALPAGAAAPALGDALLEFQVGSDLHLMATGSSEDLLHTQHAKDFLKDITLNSPNSKGVIINGDLADFGSRAQYEKFVGIVQELIEAGYTLPEIFYGIGNHELYNGTGHTYGSFDTQLSLYLKGAYAANKKTDLNDSAQYETAYRDFYLNGYHFILLSNDRASGKATLGEAQLSWLRSVLAANKNASKPTFVFLHQPLENTVSGSLTAQGWSGVDAASTAALREIFADYPEIIFFNGHTHWDMNDENNLYYRDGTLPTILNTASVGYLWTSYDKTTGVYLKGSQSYYIYVYADQVIVRGWDNEAHAWIPSAYYSISYSGLAESDETEISGAKCEGVSLTPGDRIGINSYFTFSEEVLADGTAAMRFVMPDGKIVEIPLANAARRMLQGKTALVFTVDVAPAEMADAITFRLTRNGSEVGKTYTYSVTQYADYILANRASYKDAAPVVEAMLYYGSLAKSYFGYEGTGNITLAEETLRSLKNAAAAYQPDSAFRYTKSGALPEGLTYAGSTLLLDSAVVVRHYFTLANGADIGSFTFTADGKALTPVLKNGKWYVDLPAKTVADFGTAASLMVGGFTLSYSPMSYVFAVLSAPDRYDSALVTLVRGFAVYYEAAATYFHL